MQIIAGKQILQLQYSVLKEKEEWGGAHGYFTTIAISSIHDIIRKFKKEKIVIERSEEFFSITKPVNQEILKFLNEGDIVFDGFCGTGMTGVAAQMLNRKAILSDLSPIATFIAYNYNKAVDVKEFEKRADKYN